MLTCPRSRLHSRQHLVQIRPREITPVDDHRRQSSACCECRPADSRRAAPGRRVFPARSFPARSSIPRNFAGFRVAVCSASIGVKPAATNRWSSSCRLKPGKIYTPGGVSVPARKWNTGAVHRVHHFQFFFYETLPRGEIIGVEVMHDLLGEALPRHIFPVGRRVLGPGIVSEVRLINQVAAALPHQRRALPRVILRQQREQRRRPRRIVGREKLTLASLVP